MSTGVFFGLRNARSGHPVYKPPNPPLRFLILPVLALGVQFWALSRDDGSHRFELMGLSFLLLALFALRNRKHGPMLLLLLGACLNMAPMLLHHGYMPITPESLSALYPSHQGNWPIGLTHYGSKDIIVNAADSPLWFLGDVFALALGFSMSTAFSIGDIVILGSFLWAIYHFIGRQANPFSAAS